MKLCTYNFIMITLNQKEKISNDDIKMLYRKSGKKSFKICCSILSIIMIIAIPYYCISEKEVPFFFILFFTLFWLPMTISSYKSYKGDMYACYGIVKGKCIRYAKKLSRGAPLIIPYENTVELGTFKHKYTLFQTICEYYFCTVEIDGIVYENVCCNKNDFSKINEGNKVIIYYTYTYPVVYACSTIT